MMNPMMMGMMPGMGMPAAAPAASETQTATPASGTNSKSGMTPGEKVDPQVASLCRDFRIEDRLMRKLNLVLMRRPETFRDDIVTLREKLGAPRAEVGVLITQLEKGIFVTKGSMHPDLVALVNKYGLDNRASERLVESMAKRKETRKTDLQDLDIRLGSADRPSGLLMKLLQGLDQDGRLPPAPRSLGIPGSAGGSWERERERERDRKKQEEDKTKAREDEKRQREETGKRQRERSSSKSRAASRSKSKSKKKSKEKEQDKSKDDKKKKKKKKSSSSSSSRSRSRRRR